MRMRAALIATVTSTATMLVALPAVAQAATDPGEQIAAARAYIDALVSHDASAVPLADDAYRIEDGVLTGVSGPEIRWDLDNGQQYRVISGVRDLTFTVAGDQVTSHYLLDTSLAGAELATADITEYFGVPDGTIHRIVAVVTVSPGHAPDAG